MKRGFSFQQAEDDEPIFGDPPRNWRRATLLVAVWAVALAGGALMVPSFASGVAEAERPARDQESLDAISAARRYLVGGTSEDLKHAERQLCTDAEPEVTPNDLDDLRQSFSEGRGVTDVEVTTEDPTDVDGQPTVLVTVKIVSKSNQVYHYFNVATREDDGIFCVLNAVEAEPEGAPEVEDDWQVATDYLNVIFQDRKPTLAGEFQCEDFSGADLQELDDAISDWITENGEPTRILEPADLEGKETEAGVAFSYSVIFDGDLSDESFSFEVTVKDGCITELAGDTALLGSADD